MIFPLIPLALGAIFAGWFGYQMFVGYDMKYFWENLYLFFLNTTLWKKRIMSQSWVKRLPVILASIGFGSAIFAYLIIPSLPKILVSFLKPIHTLFFNKWFFDELYDVLFVRSCVLFGNFLWLRGDQRTIDAFGPKWCIGTCS